MNNLRLVYEKQLVESIFGEEIEEIVETDRIFDEKMRQEFVKERPILWKKVVARTIDLSTMMENKD